MEVREYLSVRRSYSLMRHEVDAPVRLTFAEVAIMCHLVEEDAALRTSDLATYQGVLKPTMTHRTKHLESLGLIVRMRGTEDQRNVICAISKEGLRCVEVLCERVCDKIAQGQALSRTTPRRIRSYINDMGTISCGASELILLTMSAEGEGACLPVSEIVRRLGLLQPTVSMTIESMIRRGLVERCQRPADDPGGLGIRLTDRGRGEALRTIDLVRGVKVHRSRS